MAVLKGLERADDYKVEKIELSSMDEVTGTYEFVMADLRKGLNYGVAKSFINSQLVVLGKKLGRELPEVEESLSA